MKALLSSRRACKLALGARSGFVARECSEGAPKSSKEEKDRLQYRHVYPEFLPNPNPAFRNSLREKLERNDMLQRRRVLPIPEFYVGSVLAVTLADTNAVGKSNRFVGICIERAGAGLRAEFTLRNVINQQGIEVRYELYDPALQQLAVLRLQRSPDPHLRYLRDALPHYSTFPLDMEPDPRALLRSGAVPLLATKVELKPKPWLERWERQELRGVANIDQYLSHKHRVRRDQAAKPWEKYDLMKIYRSTIPEEQQKEIWSQVQSQLQQLQLATRQLARRKVFQLPADKLRTATTPTTTNTNVKHH